MFILRLLLLELYKYRHIVIGLLNIGRSYVSRKTIGDVRITGETNNNYGAMVCGNKFILSNTPNNVTKFRRTTYVCHNP